MLVVADNCSDDTAAIVRRFPVTVVERFSETQRGKGYALAHGLNHWRDAAPEIVVIMDADCRLTPGALDQIVCHAATQQRPAQALYLMEPPTDPSTRDQVSAFAFVFKNHVRPLGLLQLGQPCLLGGTGMAFPRHLLSEAALASGNIVEDMQLGLDLAIQGYPPLMVPDALIHGMLPQAGDAATSQRTRWEHGHIQTLMSQVPRLLKAAISQRRIALLALALELSVPPLSLLVMLWCSITAVSLLFWYFTSLPLPLFVCLGSGSFLVAAILLAWAKFGRSQLSAKTLLSIPFYLIWKIPLYLGFLTNRQKAWVRTQRDSG